MNKKSSTSHSLKYSHFDFLVVLDKSNVNEKKNDIIKIILCLFYFSSPLSSRQLQQCIENDHIKRAELLKAR